MTIHLDRVGTELGSGTVAWEPDDALLYALAVGAGPEEPAFVTENSEGVAQRVLPTFAVILGHRAQTGSLAEIGDFPLSRVLHAGQRVTLAAPLPPRGRATATRRLAAVTDKGENALIETATTLRDESDGTVLAETTSTILVRGEGGFGEGRATGSTSVPLPRSTPDHVVVETTLPQQALLYRLTGDRNPLHSDPAVAARAGFPRPILHGLCTYGFAARAVARALADGDATRVLGISARFAAPVHPGDRLTTEVWDGPDGIRFRTSVDDRVVLASGEARLA